MRNTYVYVETVKVMTHNGTTAFIEIIVYRNSAQRFPLYSQKLDELSILDFLWKKIQKTVELAIGYASSRLTVPICELNNCPTTVIV